VLGILLEDGDNLHLGFRETVRAGIVISMHGWSCQPELHVHRDWKWRLGYGEAEGLNTRVLPEVTFEGVGLLAPISCIMQHNAHDI
jgi:hypothetical protein